MSNSYPTPPDNYWSFFEIYPDAVLIINEQRKIVFWNSAASRIFGYGREEIIKRPLSTVISGDLLHWGKKESKEQRLHEPRQLIEVEGIRKNQTRFPLELSLSMYRDSDGTEFAFAILRDTTPRKQIEAELEQRVHNLDLFFSVALELSSPTDPDQFLQNVLEKILDGMDIQSGIILLLEESGERLLLKAHCGIPETICRGLKEREINADSLAVQVLSAGKPLVETNIDRVDELYKSLKKTGEPCFFIYCPLKTSEEILGLIVLQGSGNRELASNDMALLEAICRTLGQAIKHVRVDEEVIHRAREQNLIQEINTALSSAAGLDKVLETIANGMVEVFGYTGSIVFLDEEGKGRRITLKTLAYDYKIIKKVEKLLGFSLKGHEFEPEKDNAIYLLYSEQKPLITSNIPEQLALLFRRKILKKLMPAVAGLLPVKSALLTPLVVGKIVKGILVVASQQNMDENDMTRVQAFATQAALAIEKAQFFEDEQRRLAELSALRAVSSSISTSLNLKEILKATTKQMVKLFHVDHSGILAFDQTRERGNVLAEYPDRGATSESFPLKGYAAAERIMAVPKPLMIEDAHHDPLMAAVQGTIRRLDIHSMLILPLVIKGKTIGSIGLDAIGKPRTFRPQEIALAQAIADQVSVAVENARLFEDEQRQRQVNETLREISQVVGSTLELDDVLHRILEQLKKVIEFQAAAVLLVDEERRKLYVKVVEGFSEEAAKITLPLDGERGVTVHAARTGEPQYVPDIIKDKRHVSGGINRGSELAVPLKIKEKVIGVLNLESEKIDAFSQDDLQLISAFTNQASVAIENARLFEIEQSRRRLAETLGEISRVIGSTLDLDNLLHLILEQSKRILTFDTASILLFSAEKPFVAATLGYKDEGVVRRETALLMKNSPIVQKMMGTRRPVIISDAREEKDWISVPGSEHVRSWIGAPLLVRNEVIGGLIIDSAQPGSFTRKDVETVQALANQTAVAIENARLFKDLSEEKGRLELLYDISRQSTSDLELEQMLSRIIDRITSELGGHVGHLFTLEPDEQRLRLHALAGVQASASALDEKTKLRIGQGIAGWVALHRRPAVVANVAEDKRWLYMDEIDREVRSLISVPLLLGEKTLGVLSVLHHQVGYFDDPGFLRLLTAISHQVAVTIENAFLYEQVKESEERFRDVTANTGDWVWEVDAEGRYTYSSPVVARILGYSPQEVLGKHFYHFFCPEEREKLKYAAFRVFQRREPFTAFVNRNLHKDGRTVILETSGTSVIGPDGELSGYRGVDHDITARVQAEEALAASGRKFRTLVEHANDWIWTLDLEGNFTFINQAAEKDSGYKSEDWLGRSFAPLILPEDLPHVSRVLGDTLAGKSQSYEVHVYERDGTLRTLAVNTAPLYEGNRIVGTVSLGRDVTRQKQLEDQLRQAQKMEALGTLAGGIAHDFNNILGGILGYASFIKSEFPPDASLHTELDAIISLVRRAAELTKQLLAFARGGSYQIRPIDLNDIVDEVVKLLLRTVDKAILIKPVLNPDLAAVEGDAGQIQQMILNLCLNARDAMPGGGELLIETENIVVEDGFIGVFLGLKAGSYVLLRVSDTGMGMDPDIKARIFDPFFTTKEGQGVGKHSGLGLSMVYGIVHSHRGIINVYSEVGKGATFRVFLPCTEREAVKTESKLIAPMGGKETILVVDDEKIILEPVKRILKKAGYKVLLASGGREALDLFRKQDKEIDLIILDMIMPDMNGMATYKKLKEIDPEVKVLLSSGYSKNGQAQELLDDGVLGFLQKPYELADLLRKVRQVLDQN